MTKSPEKEPDWQDVVADLKDKTKLEERRNNKKREKEHDNEVKAHRKPRRSRKPTDGETDEERRTRRYKSIELDPTV